MPPSHRYHHQFSLSFLLFLPSFLDPSPMASEFPREAAAFWAQLFRAAVSASSATAAAAASSAAGEEGSQIFHPIFVGFLGQPPSDETVPPQPDRILLVDPVTRGLVVLRGDPAVLEEMLGVSEGRKGPPPASRASIEALRTVQTADAGEECAVCLDELEVAAEEVSQGRDLVKEMPCKHRFHGGCIEKWLGMHGTCPVCRYCMPAEEVGAKKNGGSGDGDVQGVRREVWFEVTFGRGGTRDLGQEQELEDQPVEGMDP
ncbi:E3 ubiquitin-protein ligase RING1 [Apostasia shenzhenica]|uniref:E3 ubiquitin-protein ligase RING1 n=1 Tax=Apostasia shenzhenica TaxID=1088818 RepID=A0A2H9ZUW5_9ASPA|nr:E3 ubiquitin-protein ligase RING1 [Apostasia shenzhenica]